MAKKKSKKKVTGKEAFENKILNGKIAWVKPRPYDKENYEFEGSQKWSVEDRNYLSQFYAECYNGYITDRVVSVFMQNDAHIKKLNLIKENPEKYARFCSRREVYNNDKKSKGKRIVSELTFIKIEFQREAINPVDQRRRDVFANQRNNAPLDKTDAEYVEIVANKTSNKLNLLKGVLDCKPRKKNPTKLDFQKEKTKQEKQFREILGDDFFLSDDQSAFMKAHMDKREEYYIFDKLIHLLDEYQTPTCKELVVNLECVFNLYQHKKISRSNVTFFIYKCFMVGKLLVGSKHKKDFSIIANIFSTIIYPEDKRGKLKKEITL